MKLHLVAAGAVLAAALFLLLRNTSNRHDVTTPVGAASEIASSDQGPARREPKPISESRSTRGKAQSNREQKADPKEMANQLISVVPAMTGEERKNDEQFDASIEVIEQISRCTSAECREIIDIVRNTNELGDDARAETLGLLVLALARIDPRTSLELRASMNDVFAGPHEDVLPEAKLLEVIHDSDPAVAADWKEKRTSAVPEK